MDSQGLLADFKNAVTQLQEALRLPAANDVIKAGCIQYFEFSFELAWKTIKRFAEEDGLTDCGSPKSALKTAFSNGWIVNEEIWLDMLSSRNKMSHTYSAADALDVFDKLSGFADALQHLAEDLSRKDS
ncbi:MAG: nucleotidyltransferase substrate binding protein [Kiritimatiellales bacterium]